MVTLREMPSPEKISGYKLAEHLLAEGGVEALVRYAGNAETDWLELKAGMCLLPEDKKKGETEKDLYWNIAKEIIALMNTSGGALIIGIHDKTLNLVPLENNDPRHLIATKGIDGYIREGVRSNVWPSNLSWTYRGKIWELADKQVPTDLISYHHALYAGPDGRIGEVIVLLVKPSEKIRLAKEDRKSSVLLKRTRGEVGEAIAIYDYDEFEKYKVSREIESAFYANVRDQFDREHAAASESAKLAVAIKEYYNGLVEKSRRMRAVFTSLDAEENVFSKDDVDQFYSPEAIETFDDEDWLDDDNENEERESNNQEEDDDSDFEEDSGEELFDKDDDAEDEYDERTARKGDLLELLKSEHRVIVSGEPGGGKTTCLTYFTLKFAEGEGEDPVLAVFIPMGQWRRGGSLSLMMKRATGLDTSQIAHLMEENRLRLVIDAVNECPDDFRTAAIQNIGMFLAEHPDIPAVISTRHPKELSSLQLPVFHVQPMDEAHRLRYLERYLADAEQAQKLLQQLGGMPGGETVAENPMLLRLVVEVYKESPEKRLPNGRAGLYRRSLRAWYKRENEKAEKAGTKLQWNRRQTFELLAVLAFKSRLRGYRDVPLEEIQAIWGDGTENQLEVLCQGPIIYCDNGFVRFRHETFQEYLCAEYLVAHQGELPAWTQADYARWGMPFAYAVELFELDKQQLPETFWLAAWRLNPWLGVALTDESKGRQLLNLRYHGTRPAVGGQPLDSRSRTPYLRAVCGAFDNWTLRYALREDDVPWYKRGDVALRYVIFVSRDCQSRWNDFERSLLHCFKGLWDKYAVKLAKNWLTLGNPRDIFQYHAPDEWDGWIESASPNMAEALLDAKIAIPEDFHAYKGRWNVELRIGAALRLFSKHVLVRSDIEEMLPSFIGDAEVKAVAGLVSIGFGDNALVAEKLRCWISEATPRTARKLIEHGLATTEHFNSRISEWVKDKSLREDADVKTISGLVAIGFGGNALIAEKLRCWISEATPSTALKLVEYGLATKDDFKSRLSEWMNDKSIPSAIALVRAGFATKNDFGDLLHTWKFFATPQMAADLLETGLMKPNDFSGRLMGWLQHPQYSYVQKYLKVSGEFTNVKENVGIIRKWIVAASIDSAALLIADGLANKKDFEKKIHEWFISTRARCQEMKKHQLIGGQEFLEFKRLNDAIRNACHAVKKGINSPKDFAVVKKSWIASANLSKLMQLINAGIATQEEVDSQIRYRISDSTPELALRLCAFHLAGTKEFVDRLSDWKQLLEPDVALQLIKNKIICEEDISDIKVNWKVIIEPKSLYCAIQLGCMTSEEAVDYLDAWGYAVPENDRMRIKTKMGIDKIQIGQLVRGMVRSVTDVGAFIALIGMDEVCGFLSINDMSWSRVKHPTEMLGVGQEVKVKIIDLDREEGRISLGLKQTTENPWNTIMERFPVGSRVTGKVVNLAAYGAFVEIAPGIEGLVHISEFSWTKRVARASDVLSVGDEVQVVVLSVDMENQKIALGIRQTQANPWDTVQERFPVGSKVKGKVRNFTEYGAIVDLEDGIDGIIHIGDMSWTRKINHPSECLQNGQEVEAVVLDVNPKGQHISLGLKQVQADPWGEIAAKYPVGSTVKGKVSKIASFGAFVELEDGVDGLVHISQISDQHVEKVKDVLVVGQEVEARVVKVDSDERRIGISIRALSMTDEEFKALYVDKEDVPQENVADRKALGGVRG